MNSYPLRSYVPPLAIAMAVFLLGNFGLYTALFGLPELAPPPAAPVEAAPPAAEGQMVDPPAQAAEPPSGPSAVWEMQEGVMRQTANIGTDMVRGTGLIAERFDVALSITLPADVADSGGGLVFHMRSRDDFAGAQMVRLANGGREVYWGYFDESRAFQGEGGAAITNVTTPMTLMLQVRAEAYTILVNGTLIAEGLPLRHEGGYIGYISFRGPVTFSDLVLSPRS